MKSKKTSAKRKRRKHDIRKTRQLCGQVAKALNYALAGECDDDVFRNLYVISVQPAPDTSRMLVTVVEHEKGLVPAGEIVARLQQVSSVLRAEVAASIHRKHTPELVFCVAAMEE